MELDVLRWPRTSVVLRLIEMEDAANRARMPTLAWAYRAALDRAEDSAMGKAGAHRGG